MYYNEIGQPLHAFDAAKDKRKQNSGKNTSKRNASSTTLDGVQRILNEEDLK